MTSRSFWILLVVALVSLGWQLGSRGLNEPDEGRVAGIGYEMYASGDLLVPTIYDRPFFNKPPLLFWLLTGSYHAFGVNEWAARLPAALSALGILLLTIAIGRRLFDPPTSILAGWLLLASPLFFAMGRIIDYNMLLTFFTTLAYWAAIAWQQDGRPAHRWTFYVALGLAFMTKGPVGPVVVALGLLGYRLLRPKETTWRPLFHLPGFMVFLAVALPWFLYVTAKFPELWQFFIGDEIIARVATDEHNRGEPLPYFFLILPAALAPWIPSLFRGVAIAWKESRAAAPIALLAGAVLLPFVLFSLSTSKLPTYILPLVPFCAILCAVTIQRLTPATRAWNVQAGWAILLVVLTPPIVTLLGLRKHGWEHTLGLPNLALLGLVAVGLVLAARRRPALLWPCLAVGLVVSYLSCHRLVLLNEDKLDAHTTTRVVARAVAPHLKPDDKFALLQRHPRGMRFYLQRDILVPSHKFVSPVEDGIEIPSPSIYGEPADIFRKFGRPECLFVLTNRRVARQIETEIVKRPVKRIYESDRFTLLSNEPVDSTPN